MEVARTTFIVLHFTVPCPPGYSWNGVTTTPGLQCTQCPRNTHQSLAGQLTCTDCPTGTGTYDTGSHASAQCYCECSTAAH